MTSHARRTPQELAGTLRRRTGLGRPLPLGGPRDGLWIAARPAVAALRQAARRVPGIRLRNLRIDPVDGSARRPAPPAPEAAAAPGPLRVAAAFAAEGGEPVTEAARRLREAVSAAAEELGLLVGTVDVEVTDLLVDGEGRSGDAEFEEDEDELSHPPGPARPAGDHHAPIGGDEALVDAAVRAVPGVLEPRGMPVVPGGPVRRGLHLSEEAGTGRLLVRVDVAVSRARRPLDVALDVRGAVTSVLPQAAVAVLVTAVE
ncbi:nucleopolyhedrovirus P10 family protein [Streptomyces sp. NPDC056600]|uniref:nucleopolyhedrovirus P10 family protein n=1 Tax=Streptomyces sp. NPDC056600 TaxID=3345874 RepID=UPI0036C8A9EA